MPRRQLGAKEGAFEVDVQHLVVLRLGGVEHRGSGLYAGVVDHDVDAAERLHGGVDEPVQVGDYVLNHVGYAIRKIPAEEIEATVAMYTELLDGPPGDLMRQDIEAERGAPP